MLEDDFLELAASVFVLLEDGTGLVDHRLGWEDVVAGPVGELFHPAERPEVEQRLVGDDLIRAAANPGDRRLLVGIDRRDPGEVTVLRRDGVVNSLSPGATPGQLSLRLASPG